MTAITMTVSFAGIYLAVAGGVVWKFGQYASTFAGGFPGGSWLARQPDQACLVGVMLVMLAVGMALAFRR